MDFCLLFPIQVLTRLDPAQASEIRQGVRHIQGDMAIDYDHILNAE